MKRLLMLVLLVGCAGGATNANRPHTPPTEADACARICDRLTDCLIAPPSCAETCARDQVRLRAGIHPSLAACHERELEHCAALTIPERRQAVSLCWAAILEVYGKDDGPTTSIVRAVCAREQRCNGKELSTEDCEAALKKKLAGSAQSKTLALVRPELVASLAACVEKASCADDDPVAACSGTRDDAAP